MTRNVMLTGGLGFIGSHTCVELIEKGYSVFILDNLSNSSKSVLDTLKVITGREIPFCEGDVCDEQLVGQFLHVNKIDSVIHFAGSKSVNESVSEPLHYYENNVIGTISLLKAMNRYDVKKIIFSSSASVYGDPKYTPIDELHPLHPTSPYAQTKKQVEEIITDLVTSDSEWNAIILRYFNPVGAHSSGLIGENPKGVPNNLVPYIAKVAAGSLPCLNVYGGDYPTKDGTGVRDYIHVVDLAMGHLSAVEYLTEEIEKFAIFNLGTGKGISVLEMVDCYEETCGKSIDRQLLDRRPGDVSECFADNTKARLKLKWVPKLGLKDMCESSWTFTNKSSE